MNAITINKIRIIAEIIQNLYLFNMLQKDGLEDPSLSDPDNDTDDDS
ncbi:MAG: hypothetical protein MUO21_06825 [Nitrososphaeraceae archaeon]|nr:hypothetical protein [Nitrososphaeraceae archaeon]